MLLPLLPKDRSLERLSLPALGLPAVKWQRCDLTLTLDCSKPWERPNKLQLCEIPRLQENIGCIEDDSVLNYFPKAFITEQKEFVHGG